MIETYPSRLTVDAAGRGRPLQAATHWAGLELASSVRETRGGPRTCIVDRRGPLSWNAYSGDASAGGADRSGGVGMAVDDLPLAVLAAIDVGDAQGVRLDRAAIQREGEAFVAEGVGQGPRWRRRPPARSGSR
jgi:hypothetical protein